MGKLNHYPRCGKKNRKSRPRLDRLGGPPGNLKILKVSRLGTEQDLPATESARPGRGTPTVDDHPPAEAVET
jgi:hypothetical protein